MKRFYKTVTVGEAEGGWRVLLDGRGIKTVGGRAGDRSVRSFRPDQLYAPAARPGLDPSLADAPGLPLD